MKTIHFVSKKLGTLVFLDGGVQITSLDFFWQSDISKRGYYRYIRVSACEVCVQ